MVLVLKRLKNRDYDLKSHPTGYDKPRIEHVTPGLQDIGLSPGVGGGGGGYSNFFPHT